MLDGPSLHVWAGEAASGWAKCGVKNASEENQCRRRLSAGGAIGSSTEGKPDRFSEVPESQVSQSQENLTTEGEVHAGSSKDDALFGIDGDLPVCPEVIEATLG